MNAEAMLAEWRQSVRAVLRGEDGPLDKRVYPGPAPERIIGSARDIREPARGVG